MIHIQKGPQPMKLREAKRNGLTCYDEMDTETKDAVKGQLFKEQYHLCAYCMRLLDMKTMQIEHYAAQNPQDADYNPESTIDYNNMLGVCPGGKGSVHKYQQLTCDQHRGNIPLTVNPLVARTIAQIKYLADGTIASDDPDINKDLDQTLNLNCAAARFKENRKAALDALKKWIKKEYGARHLSANIWKQVYGTICTDKDGAKKEYIGIIEWYLKRKMAQY